MPRSIGKVVVSFGLINVPMKLYTSADGSTRVAFNLLSPAGNRLKQQYVDPTDGQVVEHRDQHKGHEVAKGQYVVFTQDELKALNEPSTSNVTIEEFVPDGTVDPTLVEKTYYLTPEKGAEKGYELLRLAMVEAKRVALVRHCSHGKQHLAAVRATPKGLLLQHLFYADEVVPFEEVHTQPAVRLSEAELKMAGMLVNMIAADAFDPSKYRDGVKARVEAAIQAKLEGKQVQRPDHEPERAATLDLLEQLKKSLERAA